MITQLERCRRCEAHRRLPIKWNVVPNSVSFREVELTGGIWSDLLTDPCMVKGCTKNGIFIKFRVHKVADLRRHVAA